jgi:hypothetical protein
MQESLYKGRAVRFEEDHELWYFIDEDGHRQESKSLKELKSYIDKLDRKAFKRMPVLFSSYGHEIVEGSITSISPDGRNIWTVKKGDTHAQKGNYQTFYVDSEENRAKLAEMVVLRKEADALEEKCNKIEKTLKKVDVEKLKAEFLKR